MRRNSIFVGILYIAILCMPQYVEAQSSTASPGYREEGNASWYGEEFSGRPTASGEIFNPSLFTAAHPTLPFGTFLIITNRNNNRQVTVKVNDRGPFVASRIIDLSKAAAEHLDMIISGIAPVIIETLSSTYAQPPEPPPVISAPPAPVYQPAPPPVPQYATPAPIQPPPPAPQYAAPAPVQPPPPPPQYATAPAPIQPPPQSYPPEPLAPPIHSETPNAFPYPPIIVNVYPSAQAQPELQPQVPPPAHLQTQAPPPDQLQPQVPPLPPAQPQYVPPPAQFQPQPQPQYVPPQPQAQPQYVPPPAQPQPQYVPPLPPAQPQPQAQPQYAPPQMLPPLEPLPPPAFKFIPAINPLPGSLYKIQVGSYKVPRHAVDAFEKLKEAGLNPSYEPNGEFYRVVLAKIPGIEVQSVADKLARAGFQEALIREER